MNRISLICLCILLFSQCNHPKEQTTQNPEPTIDLGPLEEHILYISSRGEGFNIYMKAVGDTTEIQLTDFAPGWEWNPQIIEGKTAPVLVYNRQDSLQAFSQAGLNLVTQATAMVPTYNYPEITISPDGEWVAYSRRYPTETQLILAPYHTPADSIVIADGKSYHGRVRWSPVDHRALFISDRTGSNEVYTYDPTSGNLTQLTENQVKEKYLTWGPDGKQIAMTMSTDDESPADIFILDLASKTLTPLTQTPEINEQEIRWSPSGKYMAYHGTSNGQDHIFIVEITTGVVNQITTADAYHGEPNWAKLPLSPAN